MFVFSIFLFYSYVFLNIFFSGSRSWMSFPLSLPFFMYLFFWRPCLVWSSFFFPFFLLLHTLLVDKNVKNGDFQSESITCEVDTSHSARQGDMDDMVMKRSAANKRDKTSKAKQRWILNYILLSLHFKPQKKFSQKAFIFLFLLSPFFVSLGSFQHFLSTLFSLFTFPFIFLFISFAFLSFFFSLISPFFLFISISVCVSLSLHDRGQNTSPREMSEGGGENGHQCLKRRSLVGVFLSMSEGLSWWTWINQGECLGWWFLARFDSNSVFLVIEWLVCDTDSPRNTRKWMLIIISLCFVSLSIFTLFLLMFTLLPQHVAKSYWKDWATWGGEAEPRRFDGLCRRSKEQDRAGNTKNWGKTTPWHGRENKQTGR